MAFHYLWRAYDAAKEQNNGQLPTPYIAKALGSLHLSRLEFELAQEKYEEALRIDPKDKETVKILKKIKDIMFENGLVQTLSYGVLAPSPE